MVNYKSGDKVKVISNRNNHQLPIGTIVTIKGFSNRSSEDHDSLGKPYFIEESPVTVRHNDLELIQKSPKIIEVW